MTDLKLKSVNAEELLKIILNEFPVSSIPNPFRLLDIGCGSGSFMGELHSALNGIYTDISVEVYGYDVSEHTGGRKEYTTALLENLKSVDSRVNWKKRITVVSDSDGIPFEDGFFHLLISTQVMEHVRDHNLFFKENYRVLADNGLGVHTYPSRECLKDGHLNLWFVHWINDFDMLRAYIKFCSLFRMGKYKGKYRKEKIEAGFSISDYARYQAEYMTYQANYISIKKALILAKMNGFRATFLRYSISRVIRKFRRIFSFGLSNKNKNSFERRDNNYPDCLIINLLQRFLLSLYSRFGSVTLILEKRKEDRYGVFVK